MSYRILIVEDEVKIAEIVEDYLHNCGFETVWMQSGTGVVDWLKTNTVDLVILDIMLPGVDGLQLCQHIRVFSQMPIMLLTAKVEESDRIFGLEQGADDYLCKPFSPKEMVARVKALLRRSTTPKEVLTGWQLDVSRFKVVYEGRSAQLSMVEFAILKLLSSSPGQVFSRNQLIRQIYPDNRIVSDRTIDSHIKKLRHKLAEELSSKEFIYSVYGAGYKFEVPGENY